jgi:hypothetical protein
MDMQTAAYVPAATAFNYSLQREQQEQQQQQLLQTFQQQQQELKQLEQQEQQQLLQSFGQQVTPNPYGAQQQNAFAQQHLAQLPLPATQLPAQQNLYGQQLPLSAPAVAPPAPPYLPPTQNTQQPNVLMPPIPMPPMLQMNMPQQLIEPVLPVSMILNMPQQPPQELPQEQQHQHEQQEHPEYQQEEHQQHQQLEPFPLQESEEGLLDPPFEVNELGLRKKSKKRRDPTFPKRPLTAYNLFCEVMRPSILQDSPGLGSVDVSKTLGKMWKSSGDQVGKVYQDQSTKDRQIFHNEVRIWKRQNPGKAEYMRDENEEPGDVEEAAGDATPKKGKKRDKKRKAPSDGASGSEQKERRDRSGQPRLAQGTRLEVEFEDFNGTGACWFDGAVESQTKTGTVIYFDDGDIQDLNLNVIRFNVLGEGADARRRRLKR